MTITVSIADALTPKTAESRLQLSVHAFRSASPRPRRMCRIDHLQEFRSIKGEDESADGLSKDDQDAVDLTKLLSALQTGAAFEFAWTSRKLTRRHCHIISMANLHHRAVACPALLLPLCARHQAVAGATTDAWQQQRPCAVATV